MIKADLFRLDSCLVRRKILKVYRENDWFRLLSIHTSHRADMHCIKGMRCSGVLGVGITKLSAYFSQLHELSYYPY